MPGKYIVYLTPESFFPNRLKDEIIFFAKKERKKIIARSMIIVAPDARFNK